MDRADAQQVEAGATGAAFRAALLANVNAGGENCHRGAALGALFGAAVGLSKIPAELTVRAAVAFHHPCWTFSNTSVLQSDGEPACVLVRLSFARYPA